MKPFPACTSPRRSEYDYTSSGAYFITICTAGRQHYFWEVEDEEIRLNDAGRICEEQIKHIEQSRPYIEIHEFVVMPNHIHILLTLGTKQSLSDRRGESIIRPMDKIDQEGGLTNRPYEGPSLSSIVKLFKWNITKIIQKQWIKILFSDSFARQRSFHDRIIRNEKEYNAIKYYIQTNPQKRWEDTFYDW